MGYFNNFQTKTSTRYWTLGILFFLMFIPGINSFAIILFLIALPLSIYYGLKNGYKKSQEEFNKVQLQAIKNSVAATVNKEQKKEVVKQPNKIQPIENQSIEIKPTEIQAVTKNESENDLSEKEKLIKDFFNQQPSSEPPKVVTPPNHIEAYYNRNFVVFDFETANENLASVCALGIVIIQQSEIVSRKFYLIRPQELRVNPINYSIHGISEKELLDKPTFDVMWNDIKSYFESSILVCHNAGADINMLKSVLKAYNLSVPTIKYIDTMVLFSYLYPSVPNSKLSSFADYFDIVYTKHHALSDAEVCASILQSSLAFLTNILPNFSNESIFDLKYESKKKQSSKKKYTPAMDSKKINRSYINTNFGANISSPFYEKNVLFTGDLENFDRQEAAQLVAEKGGIIKQQVSKKVDIIIVGHNPGWAKLQKIQELQDNGKYIETIDEDTFIEWLSW